MTHGKAPRRRRAPGLSCAIVALAVLAGPAGARAAPDEAKHGAGSVPDRVTFLRPTCPPLAFDEAALERLLRVELAAAGVRDVEVAGPDPDPTSAGAAVRLSLDGACADAGAVTGRLSSGTSPQGISRAIPLGDVAWEARARTIAIVLAELVRAGSAEPAPSPAPLPPPPLPSSPLSPPRPPDPELPPRPAPASRWALSTVAEARGFFSGGGAFFGGHAGLRYQLPLVALGGAIGAYHASSTDPLGEVDLWLCTAALDVAFGGRVGPLDLHLGPEIEVGWVRARGTPQGAGVGHTADDVVVLAGFHGDVRFALGGPVSGVIDAGVGGALRGYIARADDRAPLAVRNADVRGGLGLAVGF